MRTIRFGRTGVHVPAVSLGTWGHGGPRVTESGESVGWSGHDDAQAKEALLAAYRAGMTHWDTADAYGDGHAETLIGEMWSAVPREEIFLATKFGYIYGPSRHPYDPKFMREQAGGGATQCDDTSAGQSGDVDEMGGAELLRVPQAVAKDEPTFGVHQRHRQLHELRDPGDRRSVHRDRLFD